MTKNTMIFIFLNMIYLLIWHATNKIRSTKAGKELDNGFEFYNSLNTSDKENYRKEDTKILNLFFVLFIISMNISFILCRMIMDMPFQKKCYCISLMINL